MERGSLTITRKLHETFWVGDAECQIVEVRGNRTKICVRAPLSIEVSRFPPEQRTHKKCEEVQR